MEVLRLPRTGGFNAHSHNEGINGNIPWNRRVLNVLTHNGVRVLNPDLLGRAALSPGTDGVVPWTGGFIVGTRNERRVIKSRTLKGGAALSSGNVGIISGSEGLTYTPRTN